MESLFAVSSGGTALSGSPPGNVLDRVCVCVCSSVGYRRIRHCHKSPA